MKAKGWTHHSTRADTHDWITPKYILDCLGEFDLDPSTSLSQPWPTAKNGFTVLDDGLNQKWFGRVWMNPPYGITIWKWLKKLSEHGNGIALIFSRTDTRAFHDYVFGTASAVLFLRGRVNFHRPDGTGGEKGSGSGSCLVAYGNENVRVLEKCGLAGQLVYLRGHSNRLQTYMLLDIKKELTECLSILEKKLNSRKRSRNKKSIVSDDRQCTEKRLPASVM